MELHFRVRSDGGCLISRSRIVRSLFSNLRTGYETELKVDADCDWTCIQALRWRLQSEGPIDSPMAIKERLIEFGGVERVRAALERRARPLLEYTHPQLAWQVTALGEKAVAAVIESPALLEFLEKELPNVDILELLQ